jgi:hypothetical protein
MTHSTELERTTMPRDRVRVRKDAAWPIGIRCAFALRNVRAANGIGQMRRRALVSGGDS